MKVEESKGLPEGLHQGTTTRFELRPAVDKNKKELGWKVYELFVRVDDKQVPFEPKYSLPATLNSSSKLGRTIVRFLGRELKVGEEIDMEKVLVGKKVSFLAEDDVTAKGTFSRIVEDSLKPLK